MRISLLLGALLVVTAAGCTDSDDEEASASPDSTAVASASPSASGSYVSQVNALCEAMIPKVMSVRGDEDGDGGGDIPSMDEFEHQELQLRPIAEVFDAEVDVIPVADADRAAAEAFDAYREFIDADSAKVLAAARSGDQQKYDAALEPSAEFEAKRSALNETGIDCPAR